MGRVFARKLLLSLLLLIAVYGVTLHAAELIVHDDLQREIRLPGPAQRIVSLSPHITELLFEAGASKQLVATVDYSDYPPAACDVPRIGSFAQLDFEALAALQPDLVIAWYSGNPAQQVQGVIDLGIPVYYNNPSKLEDIADSIRRFGRIMHTEDTADLQAKRFEQRLQAITEQYAGHEPVSVFYEVWDSPLMTVNDKHVIADVIRRCGGVNVFADLPVLAPRINLEDVILKRPQVIVAGINDQRSHWLPAWQQWQGIPAVAHHQIYAIDPDLITRHSSRILLGAERMCAFIDQARRSRQ